MIFAKGAEDIVASYGIIDLNVDTLKGLKLAKKKPLAKETFYLTFSGKMNLSNTFVLKPVTKLIVVKCSLSFFFLHYVFYDDEDLN